MKPVTVLSLVDFDEAHLDKLRSVSPVLEIHQHSAATFDELPAALRERVEILYGWGDRVVDAHRFPRLKWLQTHSAGIDYLLDQPIWQTEVLITNVSGIHAVPIAEHTLAMMLAFRRKLLPMWEYQNRSEWPTGRWDIFAGPELRGSTLGIVGYGAIGRELARQAQGLGMRILAVNRSGRRKPFQGYREANTGDPQAKLPETLYATGDLQKMLPKCDCVAVLAPLTPETHHLIDAGALAAMRETAFLFNLARGALVAESALVEALKEKQIAGAGLDVFETEPLPTESPLWELPNVIISPHVAGFSPKYDERATDLFAENLRRYLEQEPLLNLVGKERGY